MNKDGMARALAEKCDITNEKAHKYISALKEVIIEGLKEDGSVKWVGLGKWTKRKRKTKLVHGIPGIFDDFVKPEYFTAHFHPGKELCDKLNEV